MSSVSFTVRRPSPVSRGASSGTEPEADGNGPFKVPAIPRHLSANDRRPSPLSRSNTSSPAPKRTSNKNSRAFDERDSSDEGDEELEDELVTGFDQFGVQRLKEKKPQGPLVIPALQNKDWREAARKRRGQSFVPESGKVGTGADGSVGGLGTRDSINSGPQRSGLQLKAKRARLQGTETPQEDAKTEEKMEEELTDEQKAIKALIDSAVKGEDAGGPIIDTIPSASNRWQPVAVTEAEAYKQDVEELPDVATLDAYDRVPVSQFGAAMLRGMGWKEGQAASRTKKGPVEPWLPQARPALLGIGAKEREVPDDGDPKKRRSKKPDMKYVPVIKKEREGSDSREGSRRASPSGRDGRNERRSRRPSRSPSPDRRRNRDSDDRRDGRDRDHYRHERERDDRRRDRNDDNRRDRDSDHPQRRDKDKNEGRQRDRDDGRTKDRRDDDYSRRRDRRDY
ncbi:hypothetical protein PUNSTDRAFT_79197 [Punctularia strigosozonata HHB-11173 SS5]|uniref:uncharacterized protein n=1 Tax=Punctularia strigosozonata (strain HHB-11173) TaxID=741275 RepID=UPI0004417159|nr:uncharacterized protein PUNSTDRAFT_79197 [Punctularia strigosozonata HHB-11173 SS5]EIN13567.1 hypothetical protein PUNSTDRAFT_79197 [Punctularia strigosozonata HHB-11173 SS5]